MGSGERSVFKYDKLIGYKYRRDIRVRCRSKDPIFPGYYITTNSDGYRGRELSSVDCRADSKKVLFLGCSFTAGDGVDNKLRFTDLLENYRPDLISYNGAMPGTGNDQHYIIAKELIPKISPDYIIYTPYYGCTRRNFVSHRDFTDPLHGGLTSRIKPRFSLNGSGELVLTSSDIGGWVRSQSEGPLVGDNHIGSVVANIAKFYHKPVQLFRNALGFELAASVNHPVTHKLICEIRNLSNQFGSKFLFMPLPDINCLSPSGLPAEKAYLRLAENLRIDFINIRRIFLQFSNRARRSFFLANDGHLSPVGHIAVATILEELKLDE